MEYRVRRRFPASKSLSAESQLGYVFKAVQSADNASVLIATQDNCLRLIDMGSLAIASQITPAHDSAITDIQAVPVTVPGASSGGIFISASRDGTCKIWDIRASQESVVTVKLSPDRSDAPMFGASVGASGTCAVACGPNISLFRFGEWKKYFEYTESHFDNVSCLEFSRLPGQASVLVSGGDDGLVNVYNTDDLVNIDDGQAPLSTFNVEDSVRSFHLTQNKLFVFSTTESISVWDTSLISKVHPNVDSVRSHPLLSSDELGWGYVVGMNQDGSRLLAGNSEGILVEFDTNTFEVAHAFEKPSHSAIVRSGIYTLGGNSVLTAGEDGYLFEWSLSNGLHVSETNAHHRHQRVNVSTSPY